MKKIILSIVVLAALSVGISSCSSKICLTCSSNDINYVGWDDGAEWCSSEFPDKEEFWDHINSYKNSGWNCR